VYPGLIETILYSSLPAMQGRSPGAEAGSPPLCARRLSRAGVRCALRTVGGATDSAAL